MGRWRVKRPRWSALAVVLLAIAVLVLGDVFMARHWIEFHPYVAESLNWLFTAALATMAVYFESQEGD